MQIDIVLIVCSQLILIAACASYVLLLRRGVGELSLADARLWLAMFYFLYGIAAPFIHYGNPVLRNSVVPGSLAYGLGAIGLLLSLVVSGKITRFAPTGLRLSKSDTRAIPVVALLCLAATVILLVLEYSKIGGFQSIFILERGVRKDMLYKGSAVSLPYSMFMITFVSLSVAYVCATKKMWLSWVCILVTICFAIFSLIIGERDHLLYVGFAAIAGASITKRFRFNWQFVCVLLVGIVCFEVIAIARAFLPGLIVGERSIEEVAYRMSQRRRTVIPGEFSGPYLSLLWYINEESPPLFGESYLVSLVAPVPRIALPFEKPTPIHEEFARVWNDQVVRADHVSGKGMVPVAEAYANFWFVGPPVIMFLIGIMFNGIVRWYIRRGSVIIIVFYAFALAEAQNVNRTAFAAAFTYGVRALAIAIGIWVAVKVVGAIVGKGEERVLWPRQLSRNWSSAH